MALFVNEISCRCQGCRDNSSITSAGAAKLATSRDCTKALDFTTVASWTMGGSRTILSFASRAAAKNCPPGSGTELIIAAKEGARDFVTLRAYQSFCSLPYQYPVG